PFATVSVVGTLKIVDCAAALSAETKRTSAAVNARNLWLFIMTGLLRHWELLIECDVQHGYIDPRFAEKAQIGPFRGLRDQSCQVIVLDMSGFGNSSGLCLGVRRTDVRVQPR